MLEDIKKELLKQPEKLKDVLEHFDYCGVSIHDKYMSFGRDEYSSKKAIVIKTIENPYLYVTDYARAINQDLFTYIINQRHIEFSEILNYVKKTLGISDYYDFFNKRGIFGGFYEKIRKHSSSKMFTYDESILEKYNRIGNVRFLRDNISLEAQKVFGIRYDIESQGIVIPIRDQFGQIIGIKERFNYEVEDGELKYFYELPCAASQTLYGYSQNYSYMTNNRIYVFEAEKSVMQCFTYGIRNCVALGSGSVSKKQVQMLLELNPSEIIFMHDTGYKKEAIKRNIIMVQSYSRFSEVKIGYWNYDELDYDEKISPSDMGELKFKYIIENEIKLIGDDGIEEEL